MQVFLRFFGTFGLQGRAERELCVLEGLLGRLRDHRTLSSRRQTEVRPGPIRAGGLQEANRAKRSGDEGNRTLIPAMRPRCAPVTPRPRNHACELFYSIFSEIQYF